LLGAFGIAGGIVSGASDWDPKRPVHVLATFGPFNDKEVTAWSRDVASVERVFMASKIPCP
jgi:hypothetical protein